MPSTSSTPTLDLLHPFGESPDPGRYVPLATSERILAALAEHIAAGRSPILLSGPSGMGKTLLLQVLGEFARVSGQRVAYAPLLHVEAEACAGWLLQQLGGEAADGRSAESALLEMLRAPGSSPAVLLVDEIQEAPEGTLRRLAELTRAAHPALIVVAAGSHGSQLRRRVAELAPEAGVRFPPTLPDKEIDSLCGATLAQSKIAPEVRRALALERPQIVRAASGVPRILEAELEVRTQNILLSNGRRRPPIEELSLDTWVAREGVRAPLAGAGSVDRPDADSERAALARELPGVLEAIERRAAQQNRRRRSPSRMRRLARAGRAAWTGAFALPVAALGLVLRAARSTITTIVASGRRVRRAVFGLAGRAARGASAAVASSGRLARRALGRAGRAVRGASAAIASSGRLARQAVIGRAGRAVRGATAAIASSGRLARQAVLGRAGRAVRGATAAMASSGRLARRAALPASGLLALALLLSFQDDIVRSPLGPRFEPAAAQLEAASPAEVTKIAAHLSDASASEPALYAPREVQTQINARPWARIRIDGIDVGPTPLTYPLAPGVYRIEAEFPDGRNVMRQVEVGPERRFVALP